MHLSYLFQFFPTMNKEPTTKSEVEDQKSSASSVKADSDYETIESDTSSDESGTSSDESDGEASNVWILVYKRGGIIKSLQHLTAIVKDKLPKAKIIRKSFYIGKKLGAIKFVLPEEITYKELKLIMGKWDDYVCYNLYI